MNDFLQKVASGLSIALITGLTILAFNKPQTYVIIALWISFIATVSMFIFFIWSWGKASSNYTNFSKGSPTYIAVKILGIFSLFLIFLVLLYFLSQNTMKVGGT